MSSVTPRPLPNYAETLKSLIKMTEAFVANVYNDSGGVPTVGYGFALVVYDGVTWNLNAENTLLPVALSAAQVSELNDAIKNLSKYGRKAEAKQENDKITSALQSYSVTESQANSMLDANIEAAEIEVKRILLKNSIPRIRPV